MIRSSAAAKRAALLLALAAHGALALALRPSETAMIEGAGESAEVRLGNGFRDMAVGTLSADTAESRPPLQPLGRVRPSDAVPPAPDPTTEKPQRPAALAPEEPSARLEATAPEEPGVTRSPRPQPRRDAFVERHRDRRAVDPAPSEARPAPAASKPKAGNARSAAVKGAANGRAEARAQQSGRGGRTQEAGNAAASNYPGLVMRRLSRAGKPAVRARGAAVVAFTIGNGGNLASVSLTASSGSSDLDRAAVRLVRRAGPFPKPPQGARRSFSIRIEGR
ncbi:TonB family protein [Oceaniglobus roseus]|uniref:TonB family protein n=1 Tax=Oceaniglobus roseus TaxID=1737570 RepID=UPI000C7F3F7B|nr:TonB family protein [Kandeliimicrobium roseum]